MFTGLVEGIGTIREMIAEDPGVRLRIELPMTMREQVCAIGESVAINGCCLTVVAIHESGAVLDFQAGTETLSRTNLGELATGAGVNLERSLKVGDRLGGHFVQGHVDAIGKVTRIEQQGEWTNLFFSAPAELTRLMVEKGSIAVDGVSLTIVEVGDDFFSVACIPHTLEVTALGKRKPGDAINLEADMLAKHVAKLMDKSP